jgi:hypothetical protein
MPAMRSKGYRAPAEAAAEKAAVAAALAATEPKTDPLRELVVATDAAIMNVSDLAVLAQQRAGEALKAGDAETHSAVPRFCHDFVDQARRAISPHVARQMIALVIPAAVVATITLIALTWALRD